MYGALAIGTFVFHFVVGNDMHLIGTHMQQSVRGGISDGISFSEAVVTICLTFCTDSSNQRMFVSDSIVLALTHFAFLLRTTEEDLLWYLIGVVCQFWSVKCVLFATVGHAEKEHGITISMNITWGLVSSLF